MTLILINGTILSVLFLIVYLFSYPPYYVHIENVGGFNGKWKILQTYENGIEGQYYIKLRKATGLNRTVILLGFNKDDFLWHQEQFNNRNERGRRWRQILNSWGKSKNY